MRQHGPRGYADAAGYRDWLRDEFRYRCVYCLLREAWVPGGFHIDHFLPTVTRPDLGTEYDNLLYCCATCNLAKRDTILPEPTTSLHGAAVRVLADGTLVASTREASLLVEQLALNRTSYRRFRRMWIEVVQMAREVQSQLLERILGFPDNLPDLAGLRPPQGNSRPEGIDNSHLNRRRRGELPATY